MPSIPANITIDFDADGKADGVITDPGAPAHLPLSLAGQAPDLSHGFWF